MQLIFFSFKHRYRRKELNNLLRNSIYGKYILLNLSGPIKNIFAKLLKDNFVLRPGKKHVGIYSKSNFMC